MRSSIDTKNLPPLNVARMFYGAVRTLEKGGEKLMLNRNNLQSLANLREKAKEHEKSLLVTSSSLNSVKRSTLSTVSFKDESPPPKKPIPKSSYVFTPIIPSPVNRKITRFPSAATQSICENFYENLNNNESKGTIKLKSKSTNNLLSPSNTTKWPDPPSCRPRPPSPDLKKPQTPGATKPIKPIITNNPLSSLSIKARSSNTDHDSELKKLPKHLGPYVSEPKFSSSRNINTKMIIENGTNSFRPNSWQRVVNNNGSNNMTVNGANSVAKIFTKHNGNKYGTVGARVDNSAFMNELMANLNLIDFNYPNNSMSTRRYKRPPLQQQQMAPAVVNSSPMSRGAANYINSATIGKPLQLQPQQAFAPQTTPLVQPVPLRYNNIGHMAPQQISSHHNHTHQHKSNCPVHPRTQRPTNRHSHHHVSPHCVNCRENHIHSSNAHHHTHQHGQRWPSMGTLIDDDMISNGTVRRRVTSKSAAGHRSRCNSKSYFNDDPSNHEDDEIVIDHDSNHDNMSPKPTYVMHRSRKSRAQSIDSKLAKALANDPSLLNTSRHSSSNSITRISPMMDHNRAKGSEAQSKSKQRQVKNGSVNSRFKVEEIIELNSPGRSDEQKHTDNNNNPLQSSSTSSKSTSSDYVKELKTQLENLKNEVTRLQTAQTSLEKSLKETTSIFKPMVLGGDENGMLMNPGEGAVDLMSHFQFDQFLTGGRMSHHAGSAAYMYTDDITNATSAVSTTHNEMGGYKSAEDLLNDKSLFYGGSFIDQSYLKYLPSSNGSQHAGESSQGKLNDPTYAVSAPIYLPPTIMEPKSLALDPAKHEAATDNKATKLVNEISSTIKNNNNNKSTMLSSASLATILSRPSNATVVNPTTTTVTASAAAAVSSTKTSNNNNNTTSPSNPSSLAAAFNSTFTSTNNCLSNIINGKIGSQQTQCQVNSVSQNDQANKTTTKLEIPLSKLIVENQTNAAGSNGTNSPAYTIRPNKPIVHQRQPTIVGQMNKVAPNGRYQQVIDRELLNRSPNSQLYEKLLKMISDSSDLNLTYEMNSLLTNPVIKSRLKRLHQQLLQNPNHLLPKFESIIKNDFQSISPNSNSNTNESVTQQDLLELKNYYSKFAETNGNINYNNNNNNVAKNVVVLSNPSAGVAVSSQANSYSMSRLIDREFKRR